MEPLNEKIKISNNLVNIEKFINDVIVSPKHLLKEWSKITNQTPAVKLGYIGQHLASLITGVPGTGSGARGDDLQDGSEVKSCNKIDQADKCNSCGARVMRYDMACPSCGSQNIERKDDSKWLFTVRSKEELLQYLEMDRIVLILMDYPNFNNNDFNDIRISCFEIYPKEERGNVFCELIKNHYNNIYLPKLNNGDKTNPMNLHPWSYQFYKCNPIRTFECIVKNIDTNPQIVIDRDTYVEPNVIRDDSFDILMPSHLLKSSQEWDTLIDNADYETEIKPLLNKNCDISGESNLKNLTNTLKEEALPFLDKTLRNYLPLRPVKSTKQKTKYIRSNSVRI